MAAKSIYEPRPHSKDPREIDIFADRSALVLEWVLLRAKKNPEFRLRELVGESGVSLGLGQRVLSELVRRGFVSTEGVRTAKRYTSEKAGSLLKDWCAAYRFSAKTRGYTYTSGLGGRDQIIRALEKSKLRNDVALALHSAAWARGYGHVNLHGVELYMLDTEKRTSLEKLLRLEPKERGYEVLLLQPYYKSMLWRTKTFGESNWGKSNKTQLKTSPPLLTYLDLKSFPLRGEEQADYLLANARVLKGLRPSSSGSPA